MKRKPAQIAQAIAHTMDSAQRRLFEIRMRIRINRPSVVRPPYTRH